MKKTGMLLLSLGLASIVLTGCGQRDGLLNDGTKAYVAGDFVKSYEALVQADRLSPITEGKDLDMYNDVRNKLFVQYYNEGNTEKDRFNYEQALVYYEAANGIFSGDESLTNNISLVKTLIESQKKFDKYVKFYQPVLEDSNVILDQLNKEVDALYVLAISDKDFKLTVKGLVPESNEIVSRLDESFDKLDDDGIIAIHQELINVIQFQHQTLLSSLNYETSLEFGLDSLSQNLMEIKRQKTAVHQSLKAYANENSLAFNFDNLDKTPKEEVSTTDEKTEVTTKVETESN